MFKNALSIFLVCLLMNFAGVVAVCAQTSTDKQAEVIEKVKESVRKLGVGESARVEVKLNDGTKLKGYIRDAGQDSFVVVDKKSGATKTIEYPDVNRIKGNNRSTAARIGLDAAKAVAVTGAFVGGLILVVYVTTREKKGLTW